MLDFSLGLTRFDRISIEFIRGRTHARSFGDEASEGRLRWFERPRRRDREYVSGRILILKVADKRPE